MKIVLVDPPWHRLFGSHYNGVPLGLSYIAGFLNQFGYDTVVYNSDHKNSYSYLNQYQRMKKYKIYLENLKITNRIWKAIVKDVLSLDPSIVGISASAPTLRCGLNIARLVKEAKPEIKIVLGGVHPTISSTNGYDDFDCIISGEGEYAMLEFLKNPQRKYIKKRVIKNIDELPFPDRSSLYFKNKFTEFGHLITGRGCPFHCIYCASDKIWGKEVRLRNYKNVVLEMIEVEKEFSCKVFHFRDDTFTLNRDRALKICNGIKNRKYEWSCDTRADLLDERLLKIMSESGCKRICLGIESGNERILGLMRKGIPKSQTRKIVSSAKRFNIKVTGYFIIGYPTETNKELKDSIEFAKELDLNQLSISIFTPYPGTELYDSFQDHNTPSNFELFYHQSPAMLPRNIDQELVKEFYSLIK